MFCVGLWISKGVVKLHNGRLQASSGGIGCGSTFHLQLPLHFRKGYDSSATDECKPSMQSTTRTPGDEKIGEMCLSEQPPYTASRVIRNVLVVDDAKSNRKLVSHILEKEGYEVGEAETGQACLDMMEAYPGHYHLIFMDFGMFHIIFLYSSGVCFVLF